MKTVGEPKWEISCLMVRSCLENAASETAGKMLETTIVVESKMLDNSCAVVVFVFHNFLARALDFVVVLGLQAIVPCCLYSVDVVEVAHAVAAQELADFVVGYQTFHFEKTEGLSRMVVEEVLRLLSENLKFDSQIPWVNRAVGPYRNSVVLMHKWLASMVLC